MTFMETRKSVSTYRQSGSHLVRWSMPVAATSISVEDSSRLELDRNRGAEAGGKLYAARHQKKLKLTRRLR